MFRRDYGLFTNGLSEEEKARMPYEDPKWAEFRTRLNDVCHFQNLVDAYKACRRSSLLNTVLLHSCQPEFKALNECGARRKLLLDDFAEKRKQEVLQEMMSAAEAARTGSPSASAPGPSTG